MKRCVLSPSTRALLWKEWKNSMGLILAFFGLIVATYPFSLIRGFNKALQFQSNYHGAPIQENVFPFIASVIHRLKLAPDFSLSVLIIAAVVLLASLLVGEERKRNTYNLLLAMPFSRKQILLTKLVLGIVSIISVYLVNALLLGGIVALHPELAEFVNGRDILSWAVTQTIVVTLIFSFTFVFGSMTGTIAASAVLTGIFLIFPVGFVELVRFNLWHILKLDYANNALLPFVRLGYNTSLLLYFMDREATLARWPYLVIAAISLAKVALSLFEINPMEKNGEVLVIDILKPLFRIGVPLCFALTAGAFFADSLGLVSSYLAGAVVGGVIIHYTVGLKSR